MKQVTWRTPSGVRRKLLAAAACLLAVVIALGCWMRLGAVDATLLDQRHLLSTTILDRHGELLFDGRSSAGTRSLNIDAATIPAVVVDATVAAEDRRFFQHAGVDPVAVLRAVARNIRAGHVVEGGSTITQQTAKLLLARGGRRQRGWRSKWEELVLALRLEHRFAKRSLLALYLNLAPYGNQYSGIERASGGYFGVDPSSLTPAQAAFLAALPQRPSSLDPYRHFDRALQRQRLVLAAMSRNGSLPATEAERALHERLSVARHSNELIAPHFVAWIRELVDEPAAAEITTTLDAGLQREVRGIIDAQRAALESHGATASAIAVLDNRTGQWLAWEGSGDYFDQQHGGAIDGVRAPRQPGSALKPFTYALAFERGFDPASVLPDIESSFPTAEGGVVYAPRNYDGRFRGPLLARRALAGSVNVPAVYLLSRTGGAELLRYLRASGFTTLDRTAGHYGLGLTLGDAEVRLDELISAYSQFADDGSRGATTPLLSMKMRDGRNVASVAGRRGPVLSARSAFWIRDVLADSDARSFIFGSGGSLDFPFPVSVKTGTSQAYRDNWTVGFTRNVTVGVWVGNFDRTPLRNSSGVTGAAPLFRAVMLAAEKRFGHGDSAPRPQELSEVKLCALSGERATLACPSRTTEWLAGADRRPSCQWHYLSGSGSATPVAAVSWPLQYRAWAARQGREPDHSLQPGSTNGAARLVVNSPPDGARYLIDPTLRRDFQTLRLQASAAGGARVIWSVDGQRYRQAASNEIIRWPLRAGDHRFEVRGENGSSVVRHVEVR